MFFKLFLLFTIIPVVELALLIKVGSLIGVLNTVSVVILTAVIGAYMVRLEGIGVVARIQDSLNRGLFPADEMTDGLMILVAGALLLTPGFVTDALGFLFVFPASRGVIKRYVRKYFAGRTGITYTDI